MRLSVVGGAGAMGRALVTTAAGFDEVTELLVLDRDSRRAEELASEVGPKAKALPFDAERDDLAAVFAGSGVVASALGPFTVFGRKVAEAAIEAGCNYVDINDDWEPTLDALTLGPRAREAGVTALIGMGASPGVSNVLAASAAAELDVVHELVTGWAVAPDPSLPRGSGSCGRTPVRGVGGQTSRMSAPGWIGGGDQYSRKCRRDGTPTVPCHTPHGRPRP